MLEITSFNMLFVAAKDKGLRLASFHQDDAGFFHCAWRRDKWTFKSIDRRLPFNAALDAYLVAVGGEAPAVENTDDLFG